MAPNNSPARSLQTSCKMFLQDLQALPEEAFDKSFGPKTRTVADIVYEVNMVNDHVGMVLRGEEPFVWPDGWITAPEGFRSKSVVIESFEAATDRILGTIAGYTDAEMETSVETEDGTTTRSERARFMALHLWYHSGQLNFIQTLLGDDGWHWK